MPAAVAVLSQQALAETPSIYHLADDESSDPISIPSTWLSLKRFSSSSQQTDPVTIAHQSHQSLATSSIDCQTSPPSPSPNPTADLPDGCLAFLHSVLPLIESTLLSNLSSPAYDGFTVSWDDDRAAVTRLHTLHHLPPTSPTPLPPAATATSWNATGSLLAVAYGHLSHSGFCSHPSLLAVWNVHRRLLDPRRADTVVELTACVSALAFHPTSPSLLAVGLHSGQVRLLDLASADDPLIACSPISSLTHCEPVTGLVWAPALYPGTGTASALPTSHLLLSCGLDGKLLTWALDAGLAHPAQGLLCAPSALYHGHGASNAFPSIAITSLALSPDNLSLVTGTQGGGLLHSLHTQRRPKAGYVKSGECRWSKDAYALLDLAPLTTKFDAKRVVEQHALLTGGQPVIDLAGLFGSPVGPGLLYPGVGSGVHRAHDGGVGGVGFSPFHAGVFLTVSVDRSVRMYRVGRAEEVWAGVVGDGVAGWDVCWSVSRPLVFAVADCEGGVGVWDLAADWVKPVLVMRAEEGGGGKGVGVVKLRWSTVDGSVLAGVDVKGRAHVWQLGGKLSSIQPGEQRVLESIGATTR